MIVCRSSKYIIKALDKPGDPSLLNQLLFSICSNLLMFSLGYTHYNSLSNISQLISEWFSPSKMICKTIYSETTCKNGWFCFGFVWKNFKAKKRLINGSIKWAFLPLAMNYSLSELPWTVLLNPSSLTEQAMFGHSRWFYTRLYFISLMSQWSK